MATHFAGRKIPWAVVVPLVLAVTLGCGSGAGPVQSDAAASTGGSAVTVGYREGNRIPGFTIRLLDGSTVSSDALLNQSQPTFLFFFKYG